MGTSCKGVYKTYSADTFTRKDKQGKQQKITITNSCRCQSKPKEPRKKKPIHWATPKGKILAEYRLYKCRKNKYFPDSVGHTKKEEK